MSEELALLVEQLALRDWVKVGEAGEAQRALLAAGLAGIEALLAGMTHSNPRVRRACAGFMDHNGGDFCITPLTERLLTDPVPKVRREAVHSLGCDRCKESPLAMDAVPLLLKVAQTDPNTWVRMEAIAALHQQPRDERVVAPLRAMLERAPDRKMRDTLHGALKHHDPIYRQEHAAKMRERSRANRANAPTPPVDTPPRPPASACSPGDSTWPAAPGSPPRM
jgi:hypothetical protein